MSKVSHISFSIVCFLIFSVTVFAQDPKVVGEVTVKDLANNDPVYLEIRKLSSAADAFSGQYAKVNNFLLKKDAAEFMFSSGEIYFLKPSQGKTVGAVFLGSGELSLTPPTETEKKHLSIFTDSTAIKEGFDKLVMFFTDETFEQIKNSPNVTMGTGGSQADKAGGVYREKEEKL